MISDKRIEAIDSLIASGLNEENVQSPPRVSEALWPLLCASEINVYRPVSGRLRSECSQLR